MFRDGDRLDLSPSSTLLLAYVVLGPGGRRVRASVADLIAGDCPEGIARRRLNTALWRLRSEMGDREVIVSRGAGIGVDPTCRFSVDVTDFERTVRPLLRLPASELSEQDVSAMRDAVDLHQGELIEGSYDQWVLEERARLNGFHVSALTRLVEWFRSRQMLSEVEEYAERLLRTEPLREDVHRHLIAAYAQAGRLDMAKRQFEACRRVLADQLGVDPMPETVALHNRVASGYGTQAPRDVAAVIQELENARNEIGRLGDLVDRSLAALRVLGT